MIYLNNLKHRTDLFAIRFENEKEKTMSYYIKKNRYGEYNIIANYEEFLVLLKQSRCPVVLDMDLLVGCSEFESIKTEIHKIRNSEILSKFSVEELITELSKRTNCFVSNNIVKLSLQKGL
jgi:hypothetical protein